MTVGNREVDRQHNDLTDRLGPGDQLVRRVDSGLKLRAQTLVGVPGIIRKQQAQPISPGPDSGAVDGDKSGDERPLVTDHHAVAHQGMQPDPVLQRRWRDVLATIGDDNFLTPANDVQVSVIVEPAKITSCEPVVIRRGTLDRRWPVTGGYLRPAHQHLSVVTDRHRCPGQRPADAPRPVGARRVYAHRCRRLGEAVGTEDLHTETGHELRRRGVKECPPAHDVPKTPAESGAQGTEHQPVEHGLAGAQRRVRQRMAAADFSLVDRRAFRGAVIHRREIDAGKLAGVFPDLLQSIRDSDQKCRPEGRHNRQQISWAGEVPRTDPRPQTTKLGDPPEDMGQRQEKQGTRRLRIRSRENDTQLFHHVHRGREHIAVREHTALGRAGRAAGVNDCRKIIRAYRAPASRHHLVRYRAPPVREIIEGAAQQPPAIGGDAQATLPQHVQPLGLLDETAGHACIPDDMSDLVLRRCRVDRYGHRADRPDRKVRDDPLITGVAEYPYPVLGRDAAGQQPLRYPQHVVTEPGEGDVLPTGGCPATQNRSVRLQPLTVECHAGKPLAMRRSGSAGHAEFLHDYP